MLIRKKKNKRELPSQVGKNQLQHSLEIPLLKMPKAHEIYLRKKKEQSKLNLEQSKTRKIKNKKNNNCF